MDLLRTSIADHITEHMSTEHTWKLSCIKCSYVLPGLHSLLFWPEKQKQGENGKTGSIT